MITLSQSFSINRFRFSSFNFFQSISRSSTLTSARGNIDDTIYALSSGHLLQTAVAVIRLSGPLSKYCIETLTNKNSPVPRVATLRHIYSPENGELLDRGLVLWFPNPKSFTGEDSAELHVHGSRAVVDGIFKSFQYLNNISSNIRPAEKGEFTRRAYQNGKMDLTEVEGLADLLFADTSHQRKQALRHMEGHVRKIYENWRYDLSMSIYIYIDPSDPKLYVFVERN